MNGIIKGIIKGIQDTSDQHISTGFRPSLTRVTTTVPTSSTPMLRVLRP